MTVFIPNTTVTVERDNGTAPATGTHVPGYGDPVANWTPAATGVPAYLFEDSQRTWDPAEGRYTVRSVVVVRLRPGTDLADRDRLVDERTGSIYQVDTISDEGALVGAVDIRAVTVRVS